MHQRRATAGSTHRRNRIRETTFIQRTGSTDRRKGSRRRPSCRASATGSTHGRKRIKVRTLIQGISDRMNSSTKGTKEGIITQRVSDTHRRKMIKEGNLIQRIMDRTDSSTEEDQAVDLHRQRIQERFYIDRQRKGGHPSQHPDQQDLRNQQNLVVSLSLNKISG